MKINMRLVFSICCVIIIGFALGNLLQNANAQEKPFITGIYNNENGNWVIDCTFCGSGRVTVYKQSSASPLQMLQKQGPTSDSETVNITVQSSSLDTGQYVKACNDFDCSDFRLITAGRTQKGLIQLNPTSGVYEYSPTYVPTLTQTPETISTSPDRPRPQIDHVSYDGALGKYVVSGIHLDTDFELWYRDQEGTAPRKLASGTEYVVFVNNSSFTIIDVTYSIGQGQIRACLAGTTYCSEWKGSEGTITPYYGAPPNANGENTSSADPEHTVQVQITDRYASRDEAQQALIKGKWSDSGCVPFGSEVFLPFLAGTSCQKFAIGVDLVKTSEGLLLTPLNTSLNWIFHNSSSSAFCVKYVSNKHRINELDGHYQLECRQIGAVVNSDLPSVAIPTTSPEITQVPTLSEPAREQVTTVPTKASQAVPTQASTVSPLQPSSPATNSPLSSQRDVSAPNYDGSL